MKLSERLKAVKNLITPGLRVADVGCDHGYLAIRLIRNGISPHVIAMDINRGPLERAREHVTEAGLEGEIDLRLSDGLAELAPGEAECIVMAGMGGPLMMRIMDEGSAVCAGAREFILQPQSDIPMVRHYLEDKGYCITAEDIVYEDGKYYPMMKAVHRDPGVPPLLYCVYDKPGELPKGGEPSKDEELPKEGENPKERELTGTDRRKLWQEACYRYGGLLLKEKHPILLEYIKYDGSQLAGVRDALLDSEQTEKVICRLEEITHDLKVADEALRVISQIQ